MVIRLAVAELPVRAQGLEHLAHLQGGYFGRPSETGSVDVLLQGDQVGLAAIRRELPQATILAEVGVTFFLHRLEMGQHLILGQTCQLGEVLDLDETLDSQRVMDPESRVGLVCHVSQTSHHLLAGSAVFCRSRNQSASRLLIYSPLMSRVDPPFRADQVGSLLRPKVVLDAREQFAAGAITAADKRAIEDEAIAHAVRQVESVGMRSITDGEFRRTWFHLDFLEQLAGVEVSGAIAASSNAAETVHFTPPRLAVTGPLRHVRDIQVDDFTYLASVTTQTPKVSIPSPTMVHFRGGRAAIDIESYPDLDVFFADLAQCYRDEIAALYKAGCRYIQLDDTNLAYLCDPKMRAGAVERGDDPNECHAPTRR